MNIIKSRSQTVYRYSLWVEDDSGTPDRERTRDAWRRLFKEESPTGDYRDRYIDYGDSQESWYRLADDRADLPFTRAPVASTVYRVFGHNCEGGYIDYVEVVGR